MFIQYFGTAAAEGIPALFCQCAVCRKAREAGGKEIRTRSGAVIDRRLKLDFGPDSFVHMQRYGLNYGAMQSILITHSHSDHLATSELLFRIPGYCYQADGAPPQTSLTIYGNARVGEQIERFTHHHSNCLAFREIIPFEPVQIEDYSVVALEAVHCQDQNSGKYPVRFEGRTIYRSEDALIYMIEKKDQRILYAHDTCEFTEANMAYLAGKRMDLVSLDCTGGSWHYDYSGRVGHMTSEGCLNMREKLLAIGAADKSTVFVANHFSHNGYTAYEDMERITPGFIISYDGLTIDLDAKEKHEKQKKNLFHVDLFYRCW